MRLLRSLRTLRALARVELRQLRRHRARSLLVVLLVAVPVAAVVGGSALFQMTQPTLEERRAAVLGRSELRVEAGGSDGLAAARALLPPHARTTRLYLGLYTGDRAVGVPGRRLDARRVGLEPPALDRGSPAAGLFEITRGRAPEEPARSRSRRCCCRAWTARPTRR